MAEISQTAPTAIKRIGVLTSGGDAPGMNGLIRAVTRAGRYHGMEVMGIRRGFHGLWRGDLLPLEARAVSDTLQRGGTFLMTARSETFQSQEGLNKAVKICEIFSLDAVVCCGGDGTWQGAASLAERGIKVMALPATIDNDIGATDYTIGYDTAMNTAIECIDKLRDTASAHERCSVVEVMGRHHGYLAYSVGIATGAEMVLIPEHPISQELIVKKLLNARNRGKSHYIVVVAEGAGDAKQLATAIEADTGIETRASNLGYLQRGGNPSLQDRYYASMMGLHAVEALRMGRSNRAVVLHGKTVEDIDLQDALHREKKISLEDYKKLEILAI